MIKISIVSEIKKIKNLFTSKDLQYDFRQRIGPGSYSNPNRITFTRGNEKTVIVAAYNKVAMDVCSIDIRHVKTDENNRFSEYVDSNLDYCLSTEANIDQTSRAFIQDVVTSMLDEGCVAVVPVDVDIKNSVTNDFDVYSMRTGKITEWFPYKVKVELYNEKSGNVEEVIVDKSKVAIIENPLYSVINEYNSTMSRLINKLSMLDSADASANSGRLDLIVQLPYGVNNDRKKEIAEQRLKDLENQLENNKYGIAYIDGAEKITQLNRSVENKLMNQIEYLTNLLYSQLGLTQGILDGTADEKTMTNYYNRTVEPILSAIVDEFNRKFVSRDKRNQNECVMYFRDPFKLVPVSEIAEIADKFTRNEIMSSNELRQIVGMKPSDDPAADELRNKNLNQSTDEINYQENQEEEYINE